MTGRTATGATGVITLAGLVSLGCGEAPGGDLLSPLPEAASVIRAREVLRLGRREGEGPDVFGYVSFVSVDGRGRIYVAEGTTQEIRVFDPGGAFVRSFGRAGQGPGEFRAISGVAFDPTGRAWVWDPPQQRFAVFDSTGTFVRSVPRRWPTYAVPWPGRFTPDGQLLDVASELRGLEPDKAVTKTFRHLIRVVRLDGSMNPVDSAPPIGMDRTAFQGNYIVPFEGGIVSALESDGSMWSTHGPLYRILRTDARGDTLRSFGVDAPPVPVSPAERDSVIASMQGRSSLPAMDPSLVPEHKPAVARLVVLGPGWVGAFPELGSDTGRLLDVFTPEGRLRARVDLGVRLLLSRGAPVAAGGRLYGVTTDEFDVPYVVVLDPGVPELAR